MDKSFLKSKWSKFYRRVELFNHVPFVDFTLAAGSMAMGTARENSDFDVIIGAKSGRIFTVRFFSTLLLSLRGWRRRNHKAENKEDARDKVCLNHFVTPLSYKLSPPYNRYWYELYRSLVPMMGERKGIDRFFKENAWAEPIERVGRYSRLRKFRRSFLRRTLERALGGWLGDKVEAALKRLQVKKIESGIHYNNGYNARVIYSDHELEFHPDTRRTETYFDLAR